MPNGGHAVWKAAGSRRPRSGWESTGASGTSPSSASTKFCRISFRRRRIRMPTKEPRTMPKTEYTIEPGKQEIVTTVTLDAPRDLVFKAYTDPKLFAQWWGPRRYENKVEKFDARSGGEWRVVQVGADGATQGFRGVKHDGVTPERICQAFDHEVYPGHVALYPAGDAKGLQKYLYGASTLRFPLDEPLPVAKIRSLVKARVTEYEAAARAKRTATGARRSASARSNS